MSSPILRTPLDAAAGRPRSRWRPPSPVALLSIALARSNRSVALGILGAVVGLGVAASGAFHRAPRELSAVPPGEVALVNQQPVLMSDFIDETQTAIAGKFSDATPAQRAKVLRSMIDEELLVQRGLALNLPEQDNGVRDAISQGVNNEVIAGVLANPPSEDDLRSYFASHRADYASKGSMDVTDLVLHVGGFENVDQSLNQALADAAQAVYELRSGTPMDQVQQHFSMTNASRGTGDTLDFAAKIYLGDKLYAVAQTLSDGQVSEPIVDKDGVHVLIMHHRVAPVPADFDTVRNNVYSDYIQAQERKEEAANLKYLRSTAQIILAPGESE